MTPRLAAAALLLSIAAPRAQAARRRDARRRQRRRARARHGLFDGPVGWRHASEPARPPCPILRHGQPLTVVVPFSTQPGYDVFAYECHEGNHARRHRLNAARAGEHVIDEYVKKGPPLVRRGDADILPPDPSFGRRL